MEIKIVNIGIQGTFGITVNGALTHSVGSGKVWNRKTGAVIEMPRKGYALSVVGKPTKSGAPNCDDFIADFAKAIA